MAEQLQIGPVHHFKLTVVDPAQSRDFYTELLGFQVVGEFGPVILVSNRNVMIGLSPAPDPAQAIANDRFDENRVGLDHLSFSVESRAALERALCIFDERGVEHGEIMDLGEAFGICVLMFRDPDNIQLELASPRA